MFPEPFIFSNSLIETFSSFAIFNTKGEKKLFVSDSFFLFIIFLSSEEKLSTASLNNSSASLIGSSSLKSPLSLVSIRAIGFPI